jgi:hypothetical protein
MKVKKKVWERPQLVILAKGNPEENVLTHCKEKAYTGVSVLPQAVGQQGCDEPIGIKGECGACQSRGGSGS